jgi:hypothetical protein
MSRAGMNGSGEMAGIDRRRGKERISMQRTQMAQRCARGKTQAHKPRVDKRELRSVSRRQNTRKPDDSPVAVGFDRPGSSGHLLDWSVRRSQFSSKVLVRT